jgi:hypothetical protein
MAPLTFTPVKDPADLVSVAILPFPRMRFPIKLLQDESTSRALTRMIKIRFITVLFKLTEDTKV